MRTRAIVLAMALLPAGLVKAQQHEAVDRLMSRYEGAVPGASLLVIRDREPALQRSYGFSDLEQKIATSPASNYRLGSVTKQFTAAAILLLAEDGRLELDDSIRKWLPSLPEADTAITIRQLLTHTSGLVDYEDVMPEDTVEQLRDADVLRLLEGQDAGYFKPGSAYRYSNSGYALLALVVERAAGQSFQGFLHERIFLPLGMDRTLAYVREGPAIASRAYGFGWRITGDSLWHSGETIGFRNVIVRYPDQRLTVVMLTNRDDPEPCSTALAIANIFLKP